MVLDSNQLVIYIIATSADYGYHNSVLTANERANILAVHIGIQLVFESTNFQNLALLILHFVHKIRYLSKDRGKTMNIISIVRGMR